MRVAIGCDPNAASLAPMIEALCRETGNDPVLVATDDPIYANTAIAVGEGVASGKYDRGILVCGTGIGMAIAANKVKGVYAALISDTYSARRAVLSNDSNIACVGALTLGEKVIAELLREWLNLQYVPGTPSEQKVKRYKEYDWRR